MLLDEQKYLLFLHRSPDCPGILKLFAGVIHDKSEIQDFVVVLRNLMNNGK